jgi:cytochrome c553
VRVARIAGYGMGALAVLGVVGYGMAFTVSDRKLAETYDVAVATLMVPDDADAIAWGGHLVRSVTGCRDCHGADLAGTVMGDDPVARLVAPNLTPGRGGVGGQLTTDDWVRAIRHGVRRDGRSLLIMPSYAYARLSDRDLGAMVAYLAQLQPVDHELPPTKVRPLGRALIATGAFDDEIAARKIPDRSGYGDVDPGMSVEYGGYLATISGCTSCHRADLKGGPYGAPDAPPVPDISLAALADWGADDFFRAMRQGRRPDGTELGEFMPWRFLSGMTDDELHAIWMFMRTTGPAE